jgi:predicted lipoprotein with Yx(FWY)xxD motif
MKRLLAAALAPAVLAIIAAGCGDTQATSTTYGGGKPAGKPASGATVAAKRTELGTVLVDAKGRTLYLFEKDKGSASRCYGACAGVWPPLTGARPVAGSGVTKAKLGAVRRSDGATEITYGGHPLYTYAGDAQAGDVKGQGLDQFGAEWYALAPSGRKVDVD